MSRVVRDVSPRRALFRAAAPVLQAALDSANDDPQKVTGRIVAKCIADLMPEEEEASDNGLASEDPDIYDGYDPDGY